MADEDRPETPEELRGQAEGLIFQGPDGRVVIRTGPLTLTPEGVDAVVERLLWLRLRMPARPRRGNLPHPAVSLPAPRH